MAEKDPATAAAEAAAKELIKVAYGDLLQPAAREVGTELGEFVRAIMVAGRGFGYLIRETYEPFVLRAISKVPESRRSMPPVSLLGRILEGVSYEPEGSHVERMSSTLLSSAMDVDKSGDLHPAFLDVIHKITAQDLLVLKRIVQDPLDIRARLLGDSLVGVMCVISVDGEGRTLENADYIFENLNRSGLINIRQTSTTRPMKDFEDVAHVVTMLQHGMRDGGSFKVLPSAFGKAFVSTCVPVS